MRTQHNVLKSVTPIFKAAAGFSFIVNLLLLVPSLYMLQVYDRVLTSRNTSTLLMLTLFALLMYLLLAATEWIRAQLLINAGGTLDRELSPAVFSAALGERYPKRAFALSQHLADVTHIRQFLSGSALFAFFDAPWTPIFLAVLFLMHWWLGLVAVVGALLLVAVTWWSEKVVSQPTSKINDMQQTMMRLTADFSRNYQSAAAMGMAKALSSKWLPLQQATLHEQELVSRKSTQLAALSRLVRMMQQMAILGVGALLVVRNEVSPGVMIAASILMGRALAPLDQAIGAWRSFSSARAAYARLTAFFTNSSAAPQPLALPAPGGALQVENLSLHIPDTETLILDNIDLQVAAGSIVGLVGLSGSGKTSLMRCIVGVIAPGAGTVRLDGAQLTDWDPVFLGAHIGYLPQAVELFEGTVAENIARMEQPDPDAVIAAAKLAGIHELVLRLPDGYQTMISSDAMSLSGGQRQRVGIARALYRNPKLIVLDEPNSNLDGEGVQALQASLRQCSARGATVLISSHRPDVLSATDKILYLQQGKVKAYGPRDDVVKIIQQG